MDSQGQSRKRLAAELAVAVAQFVQATLRHDTDPRGYIHHSFQGPFDEACHTVWELGAAWGAREAGGEGLTHHEWEANRAPDEGPPSEFKFMPPDDIRRVVSARQDIAPQKLLRLITAYLRSMGDYGWRGARLSLGRAPFLPNAVFEPQIGALIECGYLKRSGAMVAWTERIAEAMPSGGAWNESRLSPGGP